MTKLIPVPEPSRDHLDLLEHMQHTRDAIALAFGLGTPKPPASFVEHSNVYPEEKLVGVQLPPVTGMHIARYGLPRGTFSRPVVVEPVRNHTELAERIADARYWERYLGVKTPGAIEQIIQSWELDR